MTKSFHVARQHFIDNSVSKTNLRDRIQDGGKKCEGRLVGVLCTVEKPLVIRNHIKKRGQKDLLTLNLIKVGK